MPGSSHVATASASALTRMRRITAPILPRAAQWRPRGNPRTALARADGPGRRKAPIVADLTGRDFLKEVDFTPDEWADLVTLAGELKDARREGREERRLQGLNLALIFEKSSTRTRAAFEVAASHQGARTTYLDPSASHIGSTSVVTKSLLAVRTRRSSRVIFSS